LSHLGKCPISRDQFGDATFHFVDTTTKLCIPSGIDIGFVRVQACKELFRKPSTILRREGFRLGRQFSDKIGHRALQGAGY
jgi:hypothetical protein